MLREGLHPSDRDLLLQADGELSPQRSDEIRQHLSACRMCRERMAELEDAIADFVRAYRSEAGVELPPIEGPRARLRARLAERGESVRQARVAGALAALLLLTAAGLWISQRG